MQHQGAYVEHLWVITESESEINDSQFIQIRACKSPLIYFMFCPSLSIISIETCIALNSTAPIGAFRGTRAQPVCKHLADACVLSEDPEQNGSKQISAHPVSCPQYRCKVSTVVRWGHLMLLSWSCTIIHTIKKSQVSALNIDSVFISIWQLTQIRQPSDVTLRWRQPIWDVASRHAQHLPNAYPAIWMLGAVGVPEEKRWHPNHNWSIHPQPTEATCNHCIYSTYITTIEMHDLLVCAQTCLR